MPTYHDAKWTAYGDAYDAYAAIIPVRAGAG